METSLIGKMESLKGGYQTMDDIEEIKSYKRSEITDTTWINKRNLLSHFYCFKPYRNYPWIAPAGTFDSLVPIKTDVRFPRYDFNNMIPFTLKKLDNRFLMGAGNHDYFIVDYKNNFIKFY